MDESHPTNEIPKKKLGRPKKLTDEEAYERQKERNRIWAKNRYHSDEKFREEKKKQCKERQQKTKIDSITISTQTD